MSSKSSLSAWKLAATRWVRKHKGKQLIKASPVASTQIVKSLRTEADKIEVIRNSSNSKTLEQFYQCIGPISND